MIIVITSLLALLLVVLLWVIFIPVYLRIDTDTDRYELMQSGTVKMSFYPGQEPLLKVRLFGFFLPAIKKSKASPPDEQKKQRKKKNPKKRSLNAWLYLLRGVKRSIRCKYVDCTVDLGDVVLNAQMVPVLLLLSRGAVNVKINFTGRYYLAMEAYGRLYILVWTFLRFLTKK